MSLDVWIVTDRRAIRKLRRNDQRLDWDWPHTPKGMVRMKNRSSWTYVCYGLTETEAVASFNRHDLDDIARLEAEIALLRKNLLHANERT